MKVSREECKRRWRELREIVSLAWSLAWLIAITLMLFAVIAVSLH